MVEYNGERTLAGMSKFLETGGTYGQAAGDEVKYRRTHFENVEPAVPKENSHNSPPIYFYFLSPMFLFYFYFS